MARSPAADKKDAQTEPEVRINIIVDPDSGETIGTMTLIDNNLSDINVKEKREELHDTDIALVIEEVSDEMEQDNVTRIMEERQKTDVTLRPVPSSCPRDIYSGMTPREAEAEQRRLESWIKWATVTGRDPAVWKQKRKLARKKAAHRRVLKRRMLVYSQRVKNAILAREGDHATHASFEGMKED